MTPIPSRHPFLIHASHRLEILAARLAREMRQRPGDPLREERVVVPHPALGQWLRLQLASQLGVAAHLRIELPAEFAWAAMREAVPTLSAVPVYEPKYLRWRIFERLGRWDSDDEIARYLADGDARKRFELADRLAIAYDRCLVYRPDSIRAWQRGESPRWHARLWAELVAGEVPGQQLRSPHWIDAIDDYRGALVAQTARPRVSFFAVATMSPSLLSLLRLATAVVDIHLFLLSPCRDFWSSVPARQAGGYYAEHNELLEAWGRRCWTPSTVSPEWPVPALRLTDISQWPVLALRLTDTSQWPVPALPLTDISQWPVPALRLTDISQWPVLALRLTDTRPPLWWTNRRPRTGHPPTPASAPCRQRCSMARHHRHRSPRTTPFRSTSATPRLAKSRYCTTGCSACSTNIPTSNPRTCWC